VLSFLSITPLPPRSTLFPYTTLFRSHGFCSLHIRRHRVCGHHYGRNALGARDPACHPSHLCHTHVREYGKGETDGTRDLLHRARSEEHTSELQSRGHLVCRLLLEKKN